MTELTQENLSLLLRATNDSLTGQRSAMGWAGRLDAGSGLLDRAPPVDGKRVFDLTLGLLLLMLCGPLLLLAMLTLWLSTLGRDPVIYRQTRVGLGGEHFTLFKLRTMCVDAERQGPRMAVVNDPRITRFGQVLRRSRIDELPQLINVLRGEMSLVGPRPERPEFVRRFESEIDGYALRHTVKPGITGLAQVKYGYTVDLEGAAVKLYYDLSYIKGAGLLRDLAILLLTVPVVLVSRGADGGASPSPAPMCW